MTSYCINTIQMFVVALEYNISFIRFYSDYQLIFIFINLYTHIIQGFQSVHAIFLVTARPDGEG